MSDIRGNEYDTVEPPIAHAMHASVHRQIKLICFQLLISTDQQARTYIHMNTTATPASEDFTFTNETEQLYRSSSFCHATYASDDTIQARWDLLSEFVRETCAIHGRDDSHGHAHMQAVAQQARTIIQQDHIDDTGNLTLDAITAAGPLIVTCIRRLPSLIPLQVPPSAADVT